MHGFPYCSVPNCTWNLVFYVYSEIKNFISYQNSLFFQFSQFFTVVHPMFSPYSIHYINFTDESKNSTECETEKIKCSSKSVDRKPSAHNLENDCEFVHENEKTTKERWIKNKQRQEEEYYVVTDGRLLNFLLFCSLNMRNVRCIRNTGPTIHIRAICCVLTAGASRFARFMSGREHQANKHATISLLLQRLLQKY